MLVLQVTFIGEGALDHGGPKREFFRLFAQGVSERYFQGVSSGIRFFVNDIMAVQVRLCKLLITRVLLSLFNH